MHKILLWLSYPMLKKFRRYLYSFWRDPRTWQTDRQTYGRRPGDSKDRAYASHRAVKSVHGFGWTVTCRQMSGHGRNWLTFEPDPDYSPHAGTGLLSPISYALQRGILLRRENSTYMYWAAATRGFTMVFFTASRWNNFVGGTCALPSVLLVWPIDLCM